MPPKPKELPKRTMTAIVRPPISNASLCYVPSDVLEGFQERLDRCVEWSLQGSAIRHHKKTCQRTDIPEVAFTQALQDKIKQSIFHGFLDQNATMTLDEYWEVILPMLIWDNENCGIEEAQICFNSVNNITDNMLKMVKKAVKVNDREILRKELKVTNVLRVNDCKITNLDMGLLEYQHLVTLNLCGNYLSKISGALLPQKLRILELQANRISSLYSFCDLPPDLLYVGLAKNLLTDDGLESIGRFPRYITALDLSDNDIYNLEPLLDLLVRLPSLHSLQLAGNPCSVCAAYSRTVFMRLHNLKWLDNREILPSDRPDKDFEPHHHDLKSAFFVFTVIRIISAPMPPKPDKGANATFHVEMELPLFDSTRRNFLMFRRYESLTELIPPPEDDDLISLSKQTTSTTKNDSKTVTIEYEAGSEQTDIFAHLEPKNSRIIQHFTTFESNMVPWNKIMNFQEPALKIFCPDLTALRDTFRSTVTIKLVYTISMPYKKEKKSTFSFKPPPGDLRVTIATIKCSLRNVDWSQPSQHFFWDDTLGTQDAIHWGDGDLSVLQYLQTSTKPTKGKVEMEPKAEKQSIPENLTCHFGFGIETIKI